LSQLRRNFRLGKSSADRRADDFGVGKAFQEAKAFRDQLTLQVRR
jgi:hypothetical protein